MSKRILAAVFAAVLSLSVLGGCGNGGSSSTPAFSGDSSKEASSTPASQAAEDYTPTFPIVSEPVTFTAATTTENMADTLWYKAYAEATNVNIEWQYWSDWDTQIGVAMAGDSLPDMTFNLWLSGVDKTTMAQYGGAGKLVDYSKYLNIMPNLSALFEEYPESRLAVSNEDGSMYGLPGYLETLTAFNGTLFYRTDMFEEAGVSEPKTTDELLEAVKTLQTYYSAKDPDFVALMPYNTWAMSGHLDTLLFPAFGDAVDLDFGATDGKTVTFNRISDQYRHYLEYLHELYTSGGFYQEVFSEDGTNTKPLIVGNHCAMTTYGTMYTADNFASGNYDVDMLAPLTSQYSSTQKYGKAYNSRLTPSMISSDCKDVETLLKWVDALYAPEDNPIADGVSSISMWLGVKGTDWDYDDDTHQTYTINVPADYDGAATNYLAQYGLSNAFNCIFTSLNSSSLGLLCKGEGTRDKLLPYAVSVFPSNYFTLSSEDSSRFAEVYTDISTYVSESYASFVLNGITDDAWSSYVSQIEKMGISDAVAIYQDAYDRYLADLG